MSEACEVPAGFEIPPLFYPIVRKSDGKPGNVVAFDEAGVHREIRRQKLIFDNDCVAVLIPLAAGKPTISLSPPISEEEVAALSLDRRDVESRMVQDWNPR